ncbi:MAG TPA: sulfatase-like hydrolase/transferase, partial [Elusimicrobiales bacterium]|nr:sulfatase-like hydrolase/transferase [Elusimicrobiales bacterium]
RWKPLLALMLCLVAADKGLSAWGGLYDKVWITGNLKLFPLYQPLRIRTFARKHLGITVEEEVRVSVPKEYSKLDYPKSPLESVTPEKPLNILLIVVDSFRYDVMNRDVTPNLWAFSRKSAVFRRHYSGGNCTRFGIFSILYGMYGNYWFSMLGERRGPALIGELKRRGYDLRLFAAAELSFPEFDKTCFVDVPREGFYDRPSGRTQVERDREITDEFLKFAGNRKSGRPYFAFIFYDASHGGYEYPPEFGKFLPADGDVNYISVNKGETLPLFNKYRNSIGFEDSLVGRILERLERDGGLKDTAVLVMGDHGEAFFEKGYHGHNRGYGAEEIRVPLVFYAPGRPAEEVDTPTSHMDIVPSLMRLIGVKNPPSDYSSGMDLFERKERPFVPVFSWDTSAIIKDDHALVIPLESYGGGLALYDPDYRQVRGRSALAPFLPYLPEFQLEAKKFYK